MNADLCTFITHVCGHYAVRVCLGKTLHIVKFGILGGLVYFFSA